MFFKNKSIKTAIATLLLAIAFSCQCPSPTTGPGNQAPSLANTNFTVSEAINDSHIIGTLGATDRDGDALTYQIITNDNGLFEVKSNSGELSLASGRNLNFNSNQQHFIIVQVSDGNATATASVTIHVTDMNVAPSFTNHMFSVSESINDSHIIGTLGATDRDGDALTYQIITNDNGLFEVKSNSGELSLASGRNLNFNSNQQHFIIVQVSDGNATATASVTIHVTDMNVAPSFTNHMFSVSEAISDNHIIGTLGATDRDGDNLTYQIITNDNGLFEVKSNSGELSLASGGNLNFNSNQQHLIIVQVSDGNATATASVTIHVTDVNVAPSFTNHMFSVSEAISDSQVIGTLGASDRDGDNLTYQIITNDNGLFEVGSNSGELSLVSGKDLNFTNDDQHQITVGARDGSLSNSALVTINVLDADVDDDDNGLIEIHNLIMLHNMRYDLAGTSYKMSSSDAGNTNGCPLSGCEGYELVRSLSFDTDGDGSTWSGSDGNYTLDSDDNHPVYFNVSQGGWEPVGNNGNSFTAIFEGNSNTISGLAVNRNINYAGMFGDTSNAHIRNLGLVSNLVYGKDNTGGLVGNQTGGSIIASYITGVTSAPLNSIIGGLVGNQKGGSIIASYSATTTKGLLATGGLVGQQTDGSSIRSSYATGTTHGYLITGGLVGEQFNGSIRSSYTTGTTSSEGSLVGGLVGLQTDDSSISSSYATGETRGDSSEVGGLVGSGEGTITASYATGETRGNRSSVGGLVGYSSAIITASYATGGTRGNSEVGGLVGQQDGGNITASYATGTASGSDFVGGLVGQQDGGNITASYGFGSVSNEGN